MLYNQTFGLILAISSTFITTYAIYYLTRKRKSSKRFIEVGRVSDIIIYPVKSFKGISFHDDEVECSMRGLKYGSLRDRKFMVVNENNRFATARQEPTMQLIEPSLSDDGQNLILSAKNQEPLRLPVNADVAQPLVHTSIFGLDICGYECGKAAEAWLSKIFKYQGYKLLAHDDDLNGRKLADDPKWKSKSLYKDEALFTDLAQYLLISEASLDDLNTRLDKSVTMARFRPNIVVNRCSAFAEDTWSEIKIGSAHLYQTHLCGRCRMTLVDPETGVMAQNEPLKTLRKFRMVDSSHPDAKALGVAPVFGVNFNIVEVGNIKVGDIVYAIVE
ncbi:mitochondrial amidoxime-reducing component 1-like [Antedon mediterranea]|uniref:mitochondrial amidoxime-reducing component 1-like n=1 Tax=Antedon mediterranea TaxID=105859 RepID=UPI003AF986FC